MIDRYQRGAVVETDLRFVAGFLNMPTAAPADAEEPCRYEPGRLA